MNAALSASPDCRLPGNNVRQAASLGFYAAFWTFPDRMQDVQTRKRRLAPFTIARTVCRLRFQRRLVTLWA